MNVPSLITVPFAKEGDKNTIPQNGSQTDVLASFQLGFPPLTMQLVGGTPPDGRDLNGVLNNVYQLLQYQQCFGGYPYNASFASAIGGYPKGSRVLASDGYSLWVNLIDDNSSNPNTGGAGWRLENAFGYIGSIVMWNSSNIPTWGVLANGQQLNSSNYPELYEAWYGSYVANQTFRVPNFTNGFYPRGFGSNTQALGARTQGQVPNVRGTFAYELRGNFDKLSGAFYYVGEVSGENSLPGGSQDSLVGFSAGRSSSVYKDAATTVETNNVATNFIVIAR